MAQWATATDVATYTGITVDDGARERAVSVVEMMCGALEDVDRDITDRDLYWLKLATCYQAAWMHNNPDVFTREDVTSAAQDGESASYRNPDSQILSPLARKALRRLSWRGVRSPAASEQAASKVVDATSEAFDDSLPWAPM